MAESFLLASTLDCPKYDALCDEMNIMDDLMSDPRGVDYDLYFSQIDGWKVINIILL